MAFAGSSDRARDERTPTARHHADATDPDATSRAAAGRAAPDPRGESDDLTDGARDARTGRGARATAARTDDAGRDDGDAASSRSRPRGRPFARSLDVDVDWPRAGSFGAGVAVGVLLGAGLALLVAPASGPTTRRRLGRAGRRAGVRAADAWADLGEELRHATFRARRKLRRRVNDKLGRDDSLLGTLRRRREHRADDAPLERTRRRAPWSRGERDTVAVEL